MSQIPTPEEFFGEEAAKYWRAEIGATHQFAFATRCPPGEDVNQWLRAKTREYFDVVKDALSASETRRQALGSEGA